MKSYINIIGLSHLAVLTVENLVILREIAERQRELDHLVHHMEQEDQGLDQEMAKVLINQEEEVVVVLEDMEVALQEVAIIVEASVAEVGVGVEVATMMSEEAAEVALALAAADCPSEINSSSNII